MSIVPRALTFFLFSFGIPVGASAEERGKLLAWKPGRKLLGQASQGTTGDESVNLLSSLLLCLPYEIQMGIDTLSSSFQTKKSCVQANNAEAGQRNQLEITDSQKCQRDTYK